MGYKDSEKRQEYDRERKRRRREIESGDRSTEVKSPDSIPEPVTQISTQIDGQVHLLAGSMGVFRNPKVVLEMSKRQLENQGWCVWRYPTLENETFVVLLHEKVKRYPTNWPALTLNPNYPLQYELERNIPGSVN